MWIVDPLDGTISYASGLPFFCVSVALAVDGSVVCGVIHDPIHGETVAAVRATAAHGWSPDHCVPSSPGAWLALLTPS